MNVVKEYFNYINKYAEASQMEMGKKVEQEHRELIKALIKKLRPDLSEAEVMKLVLETEAGIAKNHIDEFKTYYTALDKMEKELKKIK